MNPPNNNSATAEHTFRSNSSSSPATAQQQMHNPNLLQHLGQQIEFYFSEANLVKDDYLRQFLEQNNGMVPIPMIANFPMMRKICATYLWGPNLSCPVEALPPVDPTVVVQAVLLYSSNVYLLQGQWLVHPFYHQNLQHLQQQQHQRGRRTGTYHQRRKTTSNENNKPNKSHPEHNVEVDSTTKHFDCIAYGSGHANERLQSNTIKHIDSASESHGKVDATTSPTVTPTSFASNESSHPMTTTASERQEDEASPSTQLGNVIQIENVPWGMGHSQVVNWLKRHPMSYHKRNNFPYPYINPVNVERCEKDRARWWLTFDSPDKAVEAFHLLGQKYFNNRSKPLFKICSQVAFNASRSDKEQTALENTTKTHSTFYSEGVVEDKTTEQPEYNMMPHDASSSFMGSTITTAPSTDHYPAVFSEAMFARNESQGNSTSYTSHQQGMSTEPTAPAYPAPWCLPLAPAYSPTGTIHQQTGFVALPVGYPVMPQEENQQQPVFYGQPLQQGQVYPRTQHMRRHSAPPTSPPRNLHHHHPAPIAYEPVPANNGEYVDSFPIQHFPGYHTHEFWHVPNRQENGTLTNAQPKGPPRRDSSHQRHHTQRYQQEHHRRLYETTVEIPDVASLYISPPEQQTVAPAANQGEVPSDKLKNNKKKHKPKKKNQKENGPTLNGSDTNTSIEGNSTSPHSGNGGKRARKKGLQYALNSEFPPLAPTEKNSNNKPKTPNGPTPSKGYAKVLLNTAKEEEHTESV